jgi:hypothetical protein
MAETMKSKTAILAQEQTALTGIDKHFPAGTTVTLGGIQYVVADLKKVLTDDLTALTDTGTQRANLHVAVLAEQQTRAKARSVLKLLRAYIVATNGASSASVLEDLGYPPPRVTTLTVEAKALKADRMRATRVARGTKGPKQKKAIKGTVEAQITAPMPTLPTAAK